MYQGKHFNNNYMSKKILIKKLELRYQPLMVKILISFLKSIFKKRKLKI